MTPEESPEVRFARFEISVSRIDESVGEILRLMRGERPGEGLLTDVDRLKQSQARLDRLVGVAAGALVVAAVGFVWTIATHGAEILRILGEK